MLVAGCMRWRHITQALNINLIMVIVASLCLQVAMTKTGADALVGQLFVWLTQLLPLPLVLGCVMLAVMLLANLVANNAAAVVSVPVGVSIAAQLGLAAEPFVLAVVYAANMAFVSPASYQTNSMVRSAGRYASEDYQRLGIPLTAIMLTIYTFMLTWLYAL
jgi:di/tricarboxylate transporter